ncbi:PREDICTED: uncharacterized protein LOC108972418 [Bactrocera latifrons]|uniref:uncharacterized protein LOC108972418 n=1 Tax=Bactrocera latifrons TaxID=174628 RepID=UPI0008DCB50A|nr:PREDICTED: uncharacterized protein LOC108972418 [Bactrocera latifrons]
MLRESILLSLTIAVLLFVSIIPNISGKPLEQSMQGKEDQLYRNQDGAIVIVTSCENCSETRPKIVNEYANMSHGSAEYGGSSQADSGMAETNDVSESLERDA